MSSAQGDQPWQDASSFSLWHHIAQNIKRFLSRLYSKYKCMSHNDFVFHCKFTVFDFLPRHYIRHTYYNVKKTPHIEH